MKRLLICALGLIVGSLGIAVDAQPSLDADFYVSPAGSDDWSGTLADRDGSGSDGPFTTLARARDAVRELKRSKSTDIVVHIREGIYSLSETVVFGLEDSGEGDATITYAAYPGESPVLSGGTRITRWRHENDSWKATVEDIDVQRLVASGRIQICCQHSSQLI